MGKVGLFVKRSVGKDEYGQDRTRFNYEVQLGRIFCPIDAVYQRDESGKDPLYTQYRGVLDSCADDKDAPIGLDPISLLCYVDGKNRLYYAVCGNVTVPIRVPNYSTETVEDRQYKTRLVMLYNACDVVRRRPTGLLSAPVEDVEEEVDDSEEKTTEAVPAPEVAAPAPEVAAPAPEVAAPASKKGNGTPMKTDGDEQVPF